MNKQEIGSMTAKGGFINEFDICEKFKINPLALFED
jgi:hypothetical protein